MNLPLLNVLMESSDKSKRIKDAIINLYNYTDDENYLDDLRTVLGYVSDLESSVKSV